MIYLDSSCLLKLLLSEPESEAVRQAVAREGDVVVSALTELETTVQLRAGRLGAVFGERRYRAYLGQLEQFRQLDPFRFLPLPGEVFRTALRQQQTAFLCRSGLVCSRRAPCRGCEQDVFRLA